MELKEYQQGVLHKIDRYLATLAKQSLFEKVYQRGSGKKYKKCCLLKNEESTVRQREQMSRTAPLRPSPSDSAAPTNPAPGARREALRVRDQGGEPFDFGSLWERLGIKRDAD